MRRFVDQMGNTIHLEKSPQRIISLVPSQTELLFSLGLDVEIIGITRYCILPKKQTTDRQKIGGTKKFRFSVIDDLAPDLIIGNKEENYPEGIELLQEKYPVWMSDIVTLEDALDMMIYIGDLVDRPKNALKLWNEITESFANLETYLPLKVAYLIWQNPIMVAGGDTFINQMLKKCGFVNIFEDAHRYPEISQSDLETADVILLSSEPYPFSDADVKSFRKQFPSQTICLVDGMVFSWYGSRLKFAGAYFKQLRESLKNNEKLS